MSVVDLVVECTKAVGKLEDDDLKRGYAQRARRFATDMFTLGPAYVVAVVAARSSAEAVSAGATAPTCEEVVKVVAGTKGSTEEKSYAIYGAVLLYVLKKMGLVTKTDLSDIVLELQDPLLHFRAYQAAEWVKRMAEAYFK
ncbi:MAG: CRISPR-associated protein Cmr5 [Thermoproteus sp.]